MHHPRASEIEKTGGPAEQRIGCGGTAGDAPRGQPSTGGPHPVRYDWVDEGRDADGVDEVGTELDTFGNSSRNNGGRGGGEGVAKQPNGKSCWAVGVDSYGKEVCMANETIAATTGVIGGKGVPYRPPCDGGDTGVDNIFSEDVAHVFGTDCSRF